MTLRLVRADAVAPQPWRNGGGLTRELLAWPQPDRWQLRISVADIRRDGPFSAFDGVDRWFAVLDGAGVRLALPGGKPQVTADDEPLRFRGEDAPGCTLLDGPTRDLNLMLRRAAGSGLMERAAAGEPLAPPGRFRALFSADACTLLRDGAAALALPAGTLAWTDGGAHGIWRIAAEAPVRAFCIAFEPAP